MDQEIIKSIKRRIDELTYDELVIVRGYCNLKVESFKSREQSAIAAPSNIPLTPDDLREMDGDPVWWEDKKGRKGWAIVSVEEDGNMIYLVSTIIGTAVAFCYGEPNKHLAFKLYRNRI